MAFRRMANFIQFGINTLLGFTQRRVIILYRRFGTTYHSHLQGPRSLRLEDGTDSLSRNVGTELPLYAV